MLKKMYGSWSPKWFNKSLGVLLIRIAIGAVFIVHGVQKLSNMEGTIGFFNSIGFSGFWAYVVAIVETFGGLAVLLGVFITPAALLLSVVMLVVIFGVKWKMGFSGGFEFDVTLLAGLLGLIGIGAGKYSLGGSKCHCGGTCDSCSSGTCGVEGSNGATPPSASL